VRFRKEIHFPGTVEQVRALLVDPDFRNAVAAEAGSTGADTMVEETSHGTLLRTESRAPSEEFPAFARPFLGDELVIRQEEHWVGPDRAELAVTVPGKPGSMKGTLTLSPTAGGTVQTTEAEIKVAIPLLGGKLETLLGRILGHLLKLQGRLGADWLAGKR
jgi:hypothetical protein